CLAVAFIQHTNVSVGSTHTRTEHEPARVTACCVYVARTAIRSCPDQEGNLGSRHIIHTAAESPRGIMDSIAFITPLPLTGDDRRGDASHLPAVVSRAISRHFMPRSAFRVALRLAPACSVSLAR